MKISDPIAPLRTDLELQSRPDGTIDVRDPHLLQIFTLEAEELDVARHFDGERSAKQIARRLKNGKTNPRGKRAKDVLRLAGELEHIDLLDRPEVWRKDPVVDNATPYTILETSRKKLNVLPQPEPEARWTCGSCGACCRGLAVEVSDEEAARIDASLYADRLGGGDFTEQAFIDPDRPAVRILRQRPKEDGACIFLQDDGLCAVHARQGMHAKPDACQIFPHMVVRVPDAPARLATRTNCRTMQDSFETGPPVEEQGEHVLGLLETSGAYKLPKRIAFFGRRVPFAKIDELRVRINEGLAERGVTSSSIAELDRALTGRRALVARRRYAKRMMAYLDSETDGPAPVEHGALSHYFRNLPTSRDALRAMRRREPAPDVSPEVQRFLRSQMRNVLYAGGPMTFPDAGLGHAALFLALEATLHTVGRDGSLDTASDAFIAFTTPIIETTAHAWPILDALDEDYAKRLRKEL